MLISTHIDATAKFAAQDFKRTQLGKKFTLSAMTWSIGVGIKYPLRVACNLQAAPFFHEMVVPSLSFIFFFAVFVSAAAYVLY